MRSLQLLIVISSLHLFVSLISAHELCTDFSGPKQFDGALSFCTEYNGEPANGRTCCTAADEETLRNTVWNLGISKPLSDCPDMLRKLFCTTCDPWEAHLNGAEWDPTTTRTFARMCVDWCGYLYHACANEYMYWNNTPGGKNLFGGSSPYLKDDWPTVDAFCQEFAIPATDPPRENCFVGKPYTPNPPPKAPADAQPVCLEYWAPSSWSPVVTSIQDPKDGTDRLFVVYQNGKIDLHERSTGKFLNTFITIQNVLADGEAGLTAMAFHPNFANNGRFFVHYSSPVNAPGNVLACAEGGKWCGSGLYPACDNETDTCKADHFSVIGEYLVSTTDPNVASPVEERIMLIPQPFRIHNLGAMLFGPDGLLYLTFGDGGNFNDPNNRGQTLTTFLGKALRIDVDAAPDPYLKYHIPASNPFVGVPDVWTEIYALGFRNPWGCTFDDNRLICGDVGQDLVEEINIIKPGLNYGWRNWEGRVATPSNPDNSTTNGVTFAAAEYTHRFLGGNGAVIAGHVYRGPRDPALVGNYIAADHSGVIFIMPAKAGNAESFDVKYLRPLCATDSTACSNNIGNVFTIGKDSEGDLYFSTSNGILRIVELTRCANETLPPTTAPPTTLPSTTTPTPTITTPQTTTPPPVESSPPPSTVIPTTRPQSTTGRVINTTSDARVESAAMLLLIFLSAIAILF